MSVECSAGRAAFVQLTLGQHRFALPAEKVVELVSSSRLHAFPHTTPWVLGVLVRRGRIVPVCDVAPLLIGQSVSMRRFFLIVRQQRGSLRELLAIPVSGSCELFNAEPTPSGGDLPHYFSGEIAREEGEVVPVLDLDKVVAARPAVISDVAGTAAAEAQP